ncbi:hypothetical protein M5689_018845 [Euphorbia peplus]|nr:hypothetical protein M5689_018845 [Euphorbia peplus]
MQFMKQTQASIKNLETQVHQLAASSSANTNKGALPSNTEPNPRGDVMSITTRSGKGTSDPVRTDLVANDAGIEKGTQTLEKQVVPTKTQPVAKGKEPVIEEPEPEYVPPPPYVPPLPFPGALVKRKLEEEYAKIRDTLGKLHINIPLLDAATQIPNYTKFLKDLLSNKKKMENISVIQLNRDCSSILQNKQPLPRKMKDPGSFSIPLSIGELNIENALCDLGASINLMPYSVYKKLGLGEPQPTIMSIQLADRSVRYPKGIVEDVLVKVGKFILPVDFVIMDIDEDMHVPIILGRPFLATGRTIIDVERGQLFLRINDEEIVFKMNEAIKYASSIDDTCYFLDTCYSSDVLQDPTEKALETILENKMDEETGCSSKTENKPPLQTIPEPSHKEPPEVPTTQISKPELKTLPEHLEYAFLEPPNGNPVIISSKLTPTQREQLLEILKENKEAIAWKIDDIKGISPSVCVHRILMEEDHKPCIQAQMRLNPHMMEVVKNEVIKLLDAGIIYSISDSKWTSPVQVVPKKGGTTVVLNDKNELISTRTITGWRVCIDYRKLNEATRKDHFP